MTVGRIILPVIGTRLLRQKLDGALDIATHFNSTIEVVFLHGALDPATLIVDPVVDEAAWAMAEVEWDREKPSEETVAAQLKAWALRRGIRTKTVDDAPSCSLVVIRDHHAQALERQARTADLIVTGQPGDGMTTQEQEMNKLLLIRSGRALLVMPSRDTAAEPLLGHVLVAWDDGLQVSRSVALGMPLLQAAGRVSVYTSIDRETAGGTPHALILHYLRCNGIAPASVVETHGSARVGGALLAHAQRDKATLICMGAYSNPRPVQMLIGGNTRHIYSRSDIPILFSV